MIFSVFVYLTFLVSLVFCGRYQNYRIKFFDNPIPSTGILLILIYTLVVGLRYDVGVDYLLYKETYLNSMSPNADFIARNGWSYFEPGFSAIVYAFTRYKAHFAWLFISIAFLQILFLYIFSKRYSFMSMWLCFFSVTSFTFFDSLNGMRQMTAFFMFLCTLRFVEQRRFFPFFLSIVCISLFHRSILIMLPFYFVLHLRMFSNKKISAVLILLSFALSGPINYLLWNVLFPRLGELLSALDDISYFEQRDDLTLPKDTSSLGLAKFIMLGLDLLIVANINRMKAFYKSLNLDVFYNLHVIGSVLYFISGSSLALIRVNMYFVNVKFIMLSFLMYMLSSCQGRKYSWDKCLKLFLVVISLMWFFNAIFRGAKNAPFQFI